MIKNSNSKGCAVGCLFDKYIKENYFPAFGVKHLTLLRGALSDDEIRTDFIDSLNFSDNSPIKSWKDIKVGDTLFDEKGNITKVINIPFDDECDIYEITLRDGRKVRASDNHLWSIDFHNRKERQLMSI